MRTEADRRNAPRRTAFGKPIVPITAPDREALTACVWDISRTGACLIFPARVHVPAAFTIEFNNMPRQAQVMWRRDSFVGVRFTDAIPEFRLEIRSMLKPFLRSGETGAGKPNLEFLRSEKTLAVLAAFCAAMSRPFEVWHGIARRLFDIR